ncbi:MAG: DUF2934 domain-containing protein [Nitrospira sp.]|nr:DUF2934 domain-containing protein [Nitrospira sp.]
MSKEKNNAKKGNSSGTDHEISHEDIRTLAYQLFCEHGCAHGHDVEHWLEAEQQVLKRPRRN